MVPKLKKKAKRKQKKKTQLQLLKLKLKKALLMRQSQIQRIGRDNKQLQIQRIGRDNKQLQIQQTGRDVNINLRDFKSKRTPRTKKPIISAMTGPTIRASKQPATITTIGGRAAPDFNQQKVLEQKIKDLEDKKKDDKERKDEKKKAPTPPALPSSKKLLILPKLRKIKELQELQKQTNLKEEADEINKKIKTLNEEYNSNLKKLKKIKDEELKKKLASEVDIAARQLEKLNREYNDNLEKLRKLQEMQKRPPKPPAMPQPQRLLILPKLRKTETKETGTEAFKLEFQIDSKKSKIDNIQQLLKSEVANLNKMNSEIAKIDTFFIDIEKDIRDTMKDIADLETLYSRQRNKLQKKAGKQQDPNIFEKNKNEMSAIESQIKEEKEKLDTNKNKLEKLVTDKTKLTHDRSQTEKLIERLTKNEQTTSSKLKELQELQKQPPKDPALDLLSLEGPSLEAQIKEDEEFLSKVREELAKKQKELVTAANRIITSKKAEQIVVQEIRTRAEKHTHLQDILENLEENIRIRNAKIQQLTNTLKNPTREIIRELSPHEKTLTQTQQAELRVLLDDNAQKDIKEKIEALTKINETEKTEAAKIEKEISGIEKILAADARADREASEKVKAAKTEENIISTEVTDLKEKEKEVNYRIANMAKARAGKVAKKAKLEAEKKAKTKERAAVSEEEKAALEAELEEEEKAKKQLSLASKLEAEKKAKTKASLKASLKAELEAKVGAKLEAKTKAEEKGKIKEKETVIESTSAEDYMKLLKIFGQNINLIISEIIEDTTSNSIINTLKAQNDKIYKQLTADRPQLTVAQEKKIQNYISKYNAKKTDLEKDLDTLEFPEEDLKYYDLLLLEIQKILELL